MTKKVGSLIKPLPINQVIKFGGFFPKIGNIVGSRSFLLQRISRKHWHFYMAVFYVLFDGPNLNRGEVRQKELRRSQNSQFFVFTLCFPPSLRERRPIS